MRNPEYSIHIRRRQFVKGTIAVGGIALIVDGLRNIISAQKDGVQKLTGHVEVGTGLAITVASSIPSPLDQLHNEHSQQSLNSASDNSPRKYELEDMPEEEIDKDILRMGELGIFLNRKKPQ